MLPCSSFALLLIIRVPAAVEDDLSHDFYICMAIFSPVPLHHEYLLRLCVRDGIASSIIIIRRLASSLFAGCGWLWWVLALTHALHRPSSTPSCGRFWGFWDEFGAPPIFSSFCHYRCLSSSFARHLSSSLRGLSLRRFANWCNRPGRSRSIDSSRSFRPTQLKASVSPSIFFAVKK